MVHYEQYKDVWNHAFGHGPPEMQLRLPLASTSSTSETTITATVSSRINTDNKINIGKNNTIYNMNQNHTFPLVLHNGTMNATIILSASTSSKFPTTTAAPTTIASMTTTIIILHGVQGRMGNYLMQYSAAMGMADMIPGKVHLCLTPQTIRKRHSIHDQFQGPFAPICSKRILSLYSDKVKNGGSSGGDGDWREFNDTYESKFLQEAHDCIANYNQYETQQQQSLNATIVTSSSTTSKPAITTISHTPCIFRMVGFWSSHLYHNHVRENLRHIWNLTNFTPIQEYFASHEKKKSIVTTSSSSSPFPFPSTNTSRTKNTTRKTMSRRTTFIGIHVRRTDMIKVQAYQLPDMDYYKRAMQYFRDKHNDHETQAVDNNNNNNNISTKDDKNENIAFLIASDDKAWCRKQFQSISDAFVIEDDLLHGTTVSSSTAAAIELVLLAHCDYVIQSVGTFGWWAAYLSPHYQESVYPNQSYSYNPEYWTETRRKNHLVSTWVGL